MLKRVRMWCAVGIAVLALMIGAGVWFFGSRDTGEIDETRNLLYNSSFEEGELSYGKYES